MAKITQIWAREILDSRGIPTVETALKLDTGQVTLASVPSGASTGEYEAVELRDGNLKRFSGRGVLTAVDNVNNKISPALVGMDPADQFGIDKKLISLDGSPNKKNLGANAILSVSIAVTKAGAVASGTRLFDWIHRLGVTAQISAPAQPNRIPTPVFNMINGGLHGAGNLDFQEFQVIPASSKPYHLALQNSVEVYYSLEESLKRRGAIHSVGDEGGFAPNLFTNIDALEILVEAINSADFQMGRDFFLGLDIAANTLYKDGKYSIKDKSNTLGSDALIDFYEHVRDQYKITYLEDGLFGDDWDGWKELNTRLGSHLLVVGDDLLATNPDRVKKALAEKACNAALIKPNQIGTVSETMQVIGLARTTGWKIIISHRSGETNDSFIADFAVGLKSDFIKFGAPARGERLAKYNRLLAIESELMQR